MTTCPIGHESAATDYCDECGTPIGGTGASPPDGGSPASAAPRVGAAPDSLATGGTAGGGATGGGPAPDRDTRCPACHTPLDGRFCEECGHDSLAPVPRSAPGPQSTPRHPAAAEPAAGQPTPAAGQPTPAAGQPTPAAGPAGGHPTAPEDQRWLLVATADPQHFAFMQTLNGPDAARLSFPGYYPPRRFSLRGQQLLIGRRSRSRGIYPDIDLGGAPEDSAVSHTHALLVRQPDGTWAVVDLDSTNCTYLNGAAEPLEPQRPVPLTAGDHLNVGSFTRLTVTTGGDVDPDD